MKSETEKAMKDASRIKDCELLIKEKEKKGLIIDCRKKKHGR